MADNAIRSRFWLSAAILTGVVLGSGLLFWSLEGNAYSLFDSVYFALITVSTVGYSELPRMDLLPTARMVVMGMIVAGVAAVAFFQSSLTAVMVEGVIGRAWRRRIMDRKIAALRGHTIVAGCGRTGRFVIEELVESGVLQLRAAHRGERQVLRIPLAGTPIAAGTPIPVLEELQAAGATDVLEVDPRLLGRWADQAEKLYALPVKGQSMIDALINDGDIVILEPTHSCDDGDMVAVWLKAENETTLKKFFHEGSRIRLQPMNSTMQPFYTSPDNVEVQGKVLSSIRSEW